MIEIRIGRELPPKSLFWVDARTGVVADFTAAPWTFVATIVQDVTTKIPLPLVTISPNANPTAMTASSPVPSLTMYAATGAYDGLMAGPATLHVVATTTGQQDREGDWEVLIK